MKSAVASAIAFLFAVGASQACAATRIDPERLAAHIKALSSDAFEGRGPATAAEPKVIDYLVKAFRAMGLQPGGDHGGWTQDAPLVRFQVTGPISLSLSTNGQTQALTQGQEIVVQTLTPVDRVSIKDAPLVFVGYGVKAPERNWDDFKGVDLHGKIAVVLVNDPDFENPASSLFGGRAETYYGRWTFKYEEAARQGALGMLIVHETAPASYGWATVKNSNAAAQFDIQRPDASKAHPLLQGWIQRDLTVGLFKACGLDFEAQKAAAMQASFRPVPLQCASVTADYAVDHQTVVTHNVLARLPGSKRPDETLFYTAHWDHLGVGAPDAKGDRIFNGALDNASGVAGVLEIARAFASGPRPERSVVFMLTTAEEKGLLGALYYATHPIYRPETTVADINYDALEADGPARDISVRGGGEVSLEDDLAAAAHHHGRRFSPEPDPGAGRFFRADAFSFAQIGVPGISPVSGRDLVKGGKAAGDAWHAEYEAHRYHQPADEWTPDMDLTGQAEDYELGLEIGLDLANSGKWPQWTSGSEFKAVRDATAAARRRP